jgi:WD40 repeat protein
VAWSYQEPGARLVDLGSGEGIPLELPSTALTDVAFSPDGAFLAATIGGTAHLLGRDGTARGPLAGQTAEPNDDSDRETTASLTFSPDGQLLAASTSEGTLRVWSAATGEERYVVPGTSPVFSTDGTVFAADINGGRDTAVWSTSSGKQLLAVPDGGSPLAFTADGTRFATLSRHTVRMFACDPCGSLADLRTLARERLGRG